MSVPSVAGLRPGAEIGRRTVALTRADLVRYAGASGDFNPIHWSESAANAAGMEEPIAHGMLTMGHAAALVAGWVGDPARIAELTVRFTRPVPVPDVPVPDVLGPDAASAVEVTYTATVGEVRPDSTVRIELTATCDGAKVLGAARAVVRLDERDDD